MANFIPYDRSQSLLFPPDLREWVPEDNLTHFIIHAVERVGLSAFKVNWKGTGKAQYHPRMMLSLLIYSYANGIFSARRIERATYRDVGVHYVSADRHPDHDTIATFRRENAEAIHQAFLQVLVLAREIGLLKVRMISIDGTKIDANASKVRSMRYDRAQELRAKLEADIAELIARAEASEYLADEPDPQALPKEIARREALRDKLDTACRRLEQEAQNQAKSELDGKPPVAKEPVGDGKPDGGQEAPPPTGTPTGATPAEDKQSNLTDPDSQLMRKSIRHEYRQAYNAQAVVDADGSQLVLTTDVGQTPSDQPLFLSIIEQLIEEVEKPTTILADAGYAQRAAVEALEALDIEVLVAISRSRQDRPYDFRPPNPEKKLPREPKAPWRIKRRSSRPTMQRRNIDRENQLLNPSSASSKTSWASPASTSGASKRLKTNGRSSLSSLTASASTE